MYLLKYFRKLYSVFLYIKITLYCCQKLKEKTKTKFLKKIKQLECFPLTPL